MLSLEESDAIKKQIIEQVVSNFPEDKKEAAMEKIESMSPEEVEEFMKENNKMSSDSGKCVFCSIISGESESFKIDENEKAVAVLDINPLSKAHSLIIPKEHISSKEKIPKDALKLAESISKKIKSKFSAKNVSAMNQNLFGHEVISLLPIYENEKVKKEKTPAKKEELEEIQKILSEKKKKIEKKEQKVKVINEKIWMPKRIP